MDNPIEKYTILGLLASVVTAGIHFFTHKLPSIEEKRNETEKDAVRKQAEFTAVLDSLKEVVNNCVIGQNTIISQNQASEETVKDLARDLKIYGKQLEELSKRLDNLVKSSD